MATMTLTHRVPCTDHLIHRTEADVPVVVERGRRVNSLCGGKPEVSPMHEHTGHRECSACCKVLALLMDRGRW